MTNCLLTNNSASNGGGVSVLQGSSSIKNCTFSLNEAGMGGAVHASSSGADVTIRNSILWGDNGGIGKELYADSSSSFDVCYSNVQLHTVSGVGAAGSGSFTYCTTPTPVPPDPPQSPYMLDSDPQFYGDFRISFCTSPCVNTGCDAEIPSDGEDVDDDGNFGEKTPDVELRRRIIRVPSYNGNGCARNVDMGCYEEFGRNPCLGDCTGCLGQDGVGNGITDVDDMLFVINHWGPTNSNGDPGPNYHPSADMVPAPCGDVAVNVDDLLAVINGWGPCDVPPLCGEASSQAQQEVPPWVMDCYNAYMNGEISERDLVLCLEEGGE